VPQGSTAELQLQLAGGRVRELEGQLQEVQRRYKAQVDDLNGQLEAARGVQQTWQGAVGAEREARAKAIALLEGAKAVVREREQILQVARAAEGGLLQRLEVSRAEVRKQEEEAEGITQAWRAFWAELEVAKVKLQQREEEVARMGVEERGGMLLELESARATLRENEAAVAAVMEERGDLGGQLEAARRVVWEQEAEVAAAKAAACDAALQLEEARLGVRVREEEVAAVGQVQVTHGVLSTAASGAHQQRLPHPHQVEGYLGGTLQQYHHQVADVTRQGAAGSASLPPAPPGADRQQPSQKGRKRKAGKVGPASLQGVGGWGDCIVWFALAGTGSIAHKQQRFGLCGAAGRAADSIMLTLLYLAQHQCRMNMYPMQHRVHRHLCLSLASCGHNELVPLPADHSATRTLQPSATTCCRKLAACCVDAAGS
jgi:hypothetical protein